MEEPGMAMKYSRVVWLALPVTIAGPLFAMAQNAPAPAPQAYRPGLGDLMTMTVQPRHIKLGLAGQEKNWPYAKYELHELEESFGAGLAHLAEIQGAAARRHDGGHRQGSVGRGIAGHCGERRQQIRQRLCPAHRGLQRLPSGGQCRTGCDQGPGLALHRLFDFPPSSLLPSFCSTSALSR